MTELGGGNCNVLNWDSVTEHVVSYSCSAVESMNDVFFFLRVILVIVFPHLLLYDFKQIQSLRGEVYLTMCKIV